MNKLYQCDVLSAGFCFHRKPFQMSRPDGLQNYLLRLQTEGRSRTSINGVMTQVESGDLMLFGPSDPYLLIIDEEIYPLHEERIESGDYYIFCEGRWIEEWWMLKERPTLQHLPLSENLLTPFRQIVLEQRRISDNSPHISACYLQILCMEIDRLLTEQPYSTPSGYLAYRMKHFIEEHVVSPIRLADVGRHVGLSVSRAVHIFKETFGISIVQYVNEVRLEMARERILYSPMQLEHVAETCGFVNYSYFYRVFRRKYGLSPKQYRLQSRKQL
ncbi:Arabinose operon regulatory protein [compost metagenome]